MVEVQHHETFKQRNETPSPKMFITDMALDMALNADEKTICRGIGH
jgi:hypothetical protein